MKTIKLVLSPDDGAVEHVVDLLLDAIERGALTNAALQRWVSDARGCGLLTIPQMREVVARVDAGEPAGAAMARVVYGAGLERPRRTYLSHPKAYIHHWRRGAYGRHS
jgi:hypothetical protein